MADMRNIERHRSHCIDGCARRCSAHYDNIVSTAGFVLGVAAAGAGAKCNLIAGVASLVAG